MEKIKVFMEAVKNDPAATEAVKALGAPKNDAEAVAGYFKVAEMLNFSITKEEIVEGFRNYMREQKSKSDDVAEKVALAETELDGVAGGADGCVDTYQDGEWCWFTDSCSLIISYYDSGSSGNSEQGQPIPSAISDSDAFNNDTFYDPSDLDKSFICQWTDNVID